VVPWDEADRVGQVKARLPEGHAMTLLDQGMTRRSLAGFNARLAPNGSIILANKGQDAMPTVTCTDEDAWVEQLGLFELRLVFPRDHGAWGVGRALKEDLSTVEPPLRRSKENSHGSLQKV
jgi:hypothetical protein